MSQNQFRLAIVFILAVWVGIFGYAKYCEAVIPGDGVLQLKYGTQNPIFKCDATDPLNTGAYIQVISDEYVSCVIHNDYAAASIDVSFDSSTKYAEIKAGEVYPVADAFQTALHLKKNNNPCTGYRMAGSSVN